MTWGSSVFCDGTSATDPVVDADAPPAIDKDTPAIPNTGKALVRRFPFEARFAFGMASPP
jgi:hypothetical protein